MQIKVLLDDELTRNLKLGASVALNGVCLTVVEITECIARFEVTKETFSLTNLKDLKAQDLVNIERSATLADEIGGHLISGHIMIQAQVIELIKDRSNKRLWLSCPEGWFKYLFYKGFIALDGASITISEVDHEAARFAVDLIPETQKRTTLGQHQKGDSVNVEIDMQTYTTVNILERLLTSKQFRDTQLKT